MLTGAVQTTQAANTPSIIAGDGSTGVTILAANTARIGFTIQNVGTTTAYVRFGTAASATVYHYAIKGGTGNDDGLGGSIFFIAGAIYNGLITMYGASTAKVVVMEMAP